jgi:hypothetical protein
LSVGFPVLPAAALGDRASAARARWTPPSPSTGTALSARPRAPPKRLQPLSSPTRRSTPSRPPRRSEPMYSLPANSFSHLPPSFPFAFFHALTQGHAHALDPERAAVRRGAPRCQHGTGLQDLLQRRLKPP